MDGVLEPLGLAVLGVQQPGRSDGPVVVDDHVPPHVGGVAGGNPDHGVPDPPLVAVPGRPHRTELADGQDPGEHRPQGDGRAAPGLGDRSVCGVEGEPPVPELAGVSGVGVGVDVVLGHVRVAVVDVKPEPDPGRVGVVAVVGVRSGPEPFERDGRDRFGPKQRQRPSACRLRADRRPREPLREPHLGEVPVGCRRRGRLGRRRLRRVSGESAPTAGEDEQGRDRDRRPDVP